MNPARAKWNEKYQNMPSAGEPSPPAWLTLHEEMLRETAPAQATCLACGLGGDALYLAAIGFSVTALDISEIALSSLKQRADKNQLPVQTVQTDFEKSTTKLETCDLISSFYFLQKSLWPQMKRALRPGGLLIFETFSRAHLLLAEQFNPRFTVRPGELLAAFSDFILLDQRTTIVTTSSRKKQAVVSIVAQKKHA